MTEKPNIEIIKADRPKDIAAVKDIFIEYLQFVENYLGQDLSFQGTDKEFADFPKTYDTLFLAKINGKSVAACAVKPFKGKICELKRLYARPKSRGYGLGEKLMQAAIIQARHLGYETMYLDTDYGLIHANQIYEALGFTDIDRYYENPMESRYMALKL